MKWQRVGTLDIDNIHPSFYTIIRQHRNSKMSDDQFIASLIQAIKRSNTEKLPCGHGVNYVNNGSCSICYTKKKFMEEEC